MQSTRELAVSGQSPNIATPWGDSNSLRERRLPPGPGASPEDVQRSQRERLFGAMVASVSLRGYAATTLVHLTELSGVSRKTLYELFPDKETCFAATLEALLADWGTRILADQGAPEGTPEEIMRGRLEEYFALIVEQAPAARLCLIEANVAGPKARAPIDGAIEAWEELIGALFALDPERAGIPKQMITAIVRAPVGVTRSRLISNREAELPGALGEVFELMLGLRGPPEEMRSVPRGPRVESEEVSGTDKRERAIEAFTLVAAEKGYREMTIRDVLGRASMSPATFYAHFSGKEDAMSAAIESGGARLIAATLPASRQHHDLGEGIRAASRAALSFLASRASLARLLLVEVESAGAEALKRREEVLGPLATLLAPYSEEEPIAAWAIGEGLVALASRQLQRSGAESLRSLAPLFTYLALAPFVGAEEACAAANSRGRGRVTERADLAPIRRYATQLTKQRVMVLISGRPPMSAAEIAEETGAPRSVIEHLLEAVVSDGAVKVLGQEDPDAERRYFSMLGHYDAKQWASMSREDRELISSQVINLIFGEVDAVVRAGAFDSRTERTLTRVELRLDEEGWRRLAEIHDQAFQDTLEAQREASARLAESSESPIAASSVQFAFELPAELVPDKAGEPPAAP